MATKFETAQEIYLNDRQLEMKQYAQIMSKLQGLRDEIKGITAKGHNNFNNFDYIRLKDILKVVTPLLRKYKLATHHRLWMNPPLIDLVDTETGYSISFGTNCTVEPQGKNNNQVLQALGSTETYLRRYIYLQIFDLYDDDPDKNFGKESAGKKSTPKRIQKKPSVSDERLCEIAQLIGKELSQQKLQVNDDNKLKIADSMFKKQSITADEYRQIKKLIRGEIKIQINGK